VRASSYLGRNWIRHENLPKELERIDPELALTVKELAKMRESADYDPDMLTRDFNGDLELFRLQAAQVLERGRVSFQRMLDEINKTAD
jgi:hypothetical protein